MPRKATKKNVGAHLEEPLDESPHPFFAWVGLDRFEQQVEEHHLSKLFQNFTQIALKYLRKYNETCFEEEERAGSRIFL